MKANKAPEKIWIDPSTDLPKLSGHIDKGSVEYIRKDALIEKACVKLKKLMYDNLMFQGRLHREEIIETFVGEFRKYMEGE